MDRRRDKQRRGGSAGFTLVEALAAFAIVAVLSLVVQRGLVQSRLALAAVEDRITAERVARSLLAEPVRARDLQEGGRRGMIDGHRYEIRFSPLDLPFEDDDTDASGICRPGIACDPARAASNAETKVRWTPYRQNIEVATVRGPAIVVETVRLGPAP